jgi:hypothetical protein
MNNEVVFTSGVIILAWVIWKVLRRRSSIVVSKSQTETSGKVTKLERLHKFFEENHGILTGCNNVIFIILGWLVFIATILYLHHDIWSAWYSNHPLFWLSQAVFILLLAVFHSHKEAFYFLITTAVVISFWYGFSDELKENGLFVKTPESISAEVKQGAWRICWEDPKRPQVYNSEYQKAPCAPGSNVGRFVKIKEYNSARFVFTVSWKEKGVMRERSLFVWDKIANPKFGTWHQLGSEDEDHGTWRLVLRDKMFLGWVTSDKQKAKYIATMDRP